MLRIVLIAIGFILLAFQDSIIAMQTPLQYLIFIAGILFLGIPHGAADMLVTAQKTTAGKRSFPFLQLIFSYLLRLGAFALLIYFVPGVASVLFILFAAYHFGETDLHRFKTETITGKLFTLSYGLLIIAVLVLQHFDEALAILQPLLGNQWQEVQLNWIIDHRSALLSLSGLMFLASAFAYFYVNGSDDKSGNFLLQFGGILIILYQLPLLAGFMFYFIIWHSVLSLKNIFIFLRNKNQYSYRKILKDIALYSSVAITGVAVFAFAGMQLTTLDSLVLSIFLGLAILTAPHMGVMYDMYKSIRQQRSKPFDNSRLEYVG